MTPELPNPFIFNPDERFVLDEAALLDGIGFSEPEPEMSAEEIEPILKAIYRLAA